MTAILTLEYTIGDLPTAQHEAGLAGLSLFALWMEHTKAKGHFKVDIRPGGQVALSLDLEGLRSFLALYYAAETETRGGIPEEYQPAAKALRDLAAGTLGEVEIPRTWVSKFGKATRLVRDDRGLWAGLQGKPKALKPERVAAVLDKLEESAYEQLVPAGGPLLELLPPPWLRLWRSAFWATLRGAPKSRLPFAASRAGGEPIDAAKVEADLREDRRVPLSGTYLLGAAADTPEGVPIRQAARLWFLLLCWPYAATPFTVSGEGGFLWAVPEVWDLDAFVGGLTKALPARSGTSAGVFPDDARLAHPDEAPLWLARETPKGSVLGWDLYGADKPDPRKNVVLWYRHRLDVPDSDVQKEYEAVRDKAAFEREPAVLRLVQGGRSVMTEVLGPIVAAYIRAQLERQHKMSSKYRRLAAEVATELGQIGPAHLPAWLDQILVPLSPRIRKEAAPLQQGLMRDLEGFQEDALQVLRTEGSAERRTGQPTERQQLLHRVLSAHLWAEMDRTHHYHAIRQALVRDLKTDLARSREATRLTEWISTARIEGGAPLSRDHQESLDRAIRKDPSTVHAQMLLCLH